MVLLDRQPSSCVADVWAGCITVVYTLHLYGHMQIFLSSHGAEGIRGFCCITPETSYSGDVCPFAVVPRGRLLSYQSSSRVCFKSFRLGRHPHPPRVASIRMVCLQNISLKRTVVNTLFSFPGKIASKATDTKPSRCDASRTGFSKLTTLCLV